MAVEIIANTAADTTFWFGISATIDIRLLELVHSAAIRILIRLANQARTHSAVNSFSFDSDGTIGFNH